MGLDANTITTYWLSYNRDNMVIKYGKGLRWNLLSEQRLKFFLYWTPSDIVQHKEKALGEKEVAGFIHMESLIEVRKTPLVANPSPFVLDATKATLKIIEEGTLEELSQKSDSPSKDFCTIPTS